MIFATIGTQLPFDRMLASLDTWAARNSSLPIVAQVGATSRRFQHLQTVTAIPQSEFRHYMQAARLVVAHAGMGTILSAAELGKPLIIMPRLAKFGEHRNDHQQHTSHEMSRLSHVTVVANGEELHMSLDRVVARGFATPPKMATEADACAPLLEALREFVWASHSVPAHTARRPVRSST